MKCTYKNMLLWLLKNFVIVCLDTKRDTLSFLPHCLFFEKVLFYLKYSEIYKKKCSGWTIYCKYCSFNKTMCQLFKAERHHLNALKHMSIFAKLENYVHKTNSNFLSPNPTCFCRREETQRTVCTCQTQSRNEDNF